MTCKHLIDNDNCQIRKGNSDGSKDVTDSVEIQQAFKLVAEKSIYYKDAPLGVGCATQFCCFVGNIYAFWKDCPYFEI